MVEIRVEVQLYNGLPALILPFPSFLSMKKVSKKYSHMQGLFDEYLGLVEMAKGGNNNDTL